MEKVELTQTAMKSLFKVFDSGKEEISMIHDVLPAIKNDFLYEFMNKDNLLRMNDAVKSVMLMYFSQGIVFYATPVFTWDNISQTINVDDIVYKRI